jgi:hypothetical protein
MFEIFEFIMDNLVHIIIVSIIFFTSLVVFSMLNGSKSEDIRDKPIEKIVTIESMI